ncbi:hypothetical protein [uncultured Roseovarius sp.]|uniref:hypothetical protein n=1 Tax=uncultured Roseovarius sp. TaxID=293344 RepID=UPI002604957E|nr:hypothetical protein [uncultured Roseovarius sp.]
MTQQEIITKDPKAPETLDFEALLASGIAYVQSLSRDSWTDYNEHDPGVTILENLVFALTDIAYRTNHPIADIIASSAASTGTPLERLPLFTGDRAFTTAPATGNDYRKLIYDQVADVRDVWLVPVTERHGVSGLFDVFIQAFPPVASEHGAMIRPDEQAITKDVQRLLEASRGIGIDFRKVELVPEELFALDLEISIAPDENPNSCVAAVLFAVDNALNPPPEIEDVDQALYAGMPPDELFQGPKLDLGVIRDDSLRPLVTQLDLNKTRAAILDVTGVVTVGQFMTRTVRSRVCPEGPSLPTLSRRPADLNGIQVFRNGVPMKLDYGRVLLNLRHLEEKRRWQTRYAMRRMSDTSYATVPLGKDDRHLNRYRSIQHIFPEIYGIGEKGTEGAVPITERGRNQHQEQALRRARARQLKGYLTFFEQMMADHLSQLDATADLFALPSERPTYNWQALTRPSAHPDDPSNLAPILGQPTNAKDKKNSTWFQQYCDGLEAIYTNIDRPAERRGRALDHLLARFGEQFDTASLKRLYDQEHQPRDVFEQWLLKRKAELLENVIDLGGKRGLGIDLSNSASCPLETRIALRSGHDAPLYLIEHILLRDGARGGGIGAEQIGVDFAVTAPPPLTAFRLALDGYSVHWILDPQPLASETSSLLELLVTLGADQAHYTAYPPGSYQVSVRIEQNAGLGVDVLENFRSMDEAKACIADMQRICQEAQKTKRVPSDFVEPVYLPLDFYNHGVSLIISPGTEGTSEDRRAFVSEIAAAEIPAHLSCVHLWLHRDEIDSFDTDYKEWQKIHRGVRATAFPSAAARQEAVERSEKLRNHIHRLYCASIQNARKRRRESVGVK